MTVSDTDGSSTGNGANAGAAASSGVPSAGNAPGPIADGRWGELDQHLFNEGRHWRLWQHLGSHPLAGSTSGTWFAVWAPDARAVSVIGDFNHYVRGSDSLNPVGSTGVWSGFVATATIGQTYKYAITTSDGSELDKADPMAQATEVPPRTASVITASTYQWSDRTWMADKVTSNPWKSQISIYEVHLASWKHLSSYGEMAEELATYVKDLGFTHVELLPVAEHPFGGSWGYQVSSYFAPTSRFGSPDDFRAFVDVLHANGIGVIVDWVPAHFPKDEWSLGRFDGTALYEHADPRQGEHPDWGTYVFNYGRHEVSNFLVANALYWLEEFHVDGLRVDAVASMLYLDYSRNDGEWIPNEHGGRENTAAVRFLRELNTVVHAEHPGVLMIAEESTAWPSVSRPVDAGGLGFGFKWNMGWMHDTLQYFSKESVHRQYHHHDLTFGLLYAFTENFMLPLSHDEVVHGKGSLIGRMPGDPWQKRANLRALFGWMWAHPGKQLLFMGGELGQWSEWNADSSLDWWLLDDPAHRGIQNLLRDLNAVQHAHRALVTRDFEPEGFGWLVGDDAEGNVIAFVRWDDDGGGRPVVCVANLSPVVRTDYALALPRGGTWQEILNTDAEIYGGSGVGNGGWIHADDLGRVAITLPPLAVLYFLST
jgi:1,4-alpha-glucan branching enzyme